jgi:type IV pilus assembly protein PilW
MRRQHGLTLIEFMISITIGMVIVAALTMLIAQQSATQSEFEKSSRQIENGRYATQILSDDLQMAGYYGEFTKSSDMAIPGTLPDPCSTTVADIEAAMVFPVQGYDSPSTTSGILSCIHQDNHLDGTDILVVRRAEPDTLSIAAAASGAVGQVYLQTGLTGSFLEFTKAMGTGTDAAGTSVFTLYNKDKTTLSSLRKFLVHIYFISPCSVPSGTYCSSAADGGKPIPTLKMVELSSSGAMTTTPLVEGIENMQIDYGFDTTADGSPDGQFKSTATAVADWVDTMALRVHLLARNNDSSPDYLDTKTYTLGYNSSASAQQFTVSTDIYGNNVRPYKRRVFSQMIRLVNPSGRLDK